jgi:hypothetical protein
MLRTVAPRKRIDRLRVVADHGQAAAVGLHGQQDRGLQAVGVLVLVDQHVVERPPISAASAGRHHLRPVEQQVVVIEHLLRLLGLDVGGGTVPSARSSHSGAPREGARCSTRSSGACVLTTAE